MKKKPNSGGKKRAARKSTRHSDGAVHAMEELVFDALPHPAAIIGRDFRILRANRVLLKQLGKKPSQLLDQPCYRCFHQSDKPEEQCPHYLAMKDGKEHTAEYSDPLTGVIRLVTAKPVLDQKNKIIGSIHITQDINEFRKQQERISPREIQFQRLAQSMTDGLMIVENHLVTFVNKRLTEILGYSAEELCRLKGRDTAVPEDAPKLEQAFRSFQNSNIKRMELEYRALRKDKKQIYVLNRYFYDSSLPDPQQRYFIITSDITERRHSEEGLRIHHELAVSLGTTSDKSTALNKVLDIMLTLEGVDCGGIYLVNRKTGGANLFCHRGLSPAYAGQVSLYTSDTPQMQLLSGGVPIYADYESIKSIPKDAIRRAEGLKMIAMVPILYEDKLIAVMNLSSHTVTDFPKHIREIMESASGLIASFIVRIRAEDDILQVNNNLETLFDSINDFLFVVDENRRIIDVNPIVIRRLGYSREELQKMDLLSLYPPDRKKEVKESIDDIFGERKDSGSMPLKAKNGEIIPIETKVTRGFWNGLPVFFGISRDISERKRAQESLRHSEERYYRLFSGMTQGGAIHQVLRDASGRPVDYITLEVNGSYERVLNISRDEVIGKKISKILSRQELNTWLETFDRVLRGSGPIHYEQYSPLYKKYFEGYAYSPEPDQFVTLFEDITERKHMETALREETDRRRILFDRSPIGIVIIDPETARILEFNDTAHRQLGFTREEFSRLSVFDIEANETQEQTKKQIAKVVREGMDEFETLQRTKNGEIRNILVTAQNIDVEGHPVYQCFWHDITEQKQTERKIMENEARIRSMLETAMDGFWIISSDAHVLEVNDAYCLMSGYSREEIIHMPITKIDAKYNPEEVQEIVDSVFKNGPKLFETVHRRKDGSVFNTEVSIQQAALSPDTQFAFLRDITEHKRAEQTAVENEARVRSIIETLMDGFCVIDERGNILETNDAYCQMSGYSQEELLKMNINDIDIRGKSGENRDLINTVIRQGKSRFETTHRRKNGSFFDVEVVAQRSAFGPHTLFSFICDITERKKAEKNLKEAKRKLESTLNALPDLLFEIDVNGTVYDYRAPDKSQLYIPPEQFMGKSVYAVLPENVGEKIRACVEAAMKNEIPPDSTYSLAVSGEERWFELSISRSQEETPGGQDRLIVLSRDVTKRKSAQDELLELNRTLAEKISRAVSEIRDKDQMIILQSRQAAMGEMVGNIAHQWRQPLNAVGILVQNLLLHEKAGDLDGAYLENNVKKAMDLLLHMSRTIDDFRNFFKTDKEKTSFSLKTAVENALSFVSASYADHGIVSGTDCPEDMTVTGYPNEFSQALLNILNNALEVIKERNPAGPQVSVRVLCENGHPTVTISDNAGGIVPENIHKIFDPFFTTKEMGTGIGLYMAKAIIEKNMGGRLTACNTGQGAEFRIEF